METQKPKSISKKIVFNIILFLFTFLLVEGTSYIFGKLLNQKGFLYIPHALEDYDDYLLERDEVLGWPSPESFGKTDSNRNRDKMGSRIIPAFPAETEACLSLYGDSYTWSSEVDDENAWGNVLSIKMNCRVTNYGVGGYGTDQMYLRFKQNTHDKATIVILAHTTTDILRNITQYRTLQTGISNHNLKPRFIINSEGKLELIPIPSLSKEEYVEMVENPALYLKQEYYVPDSDGGLKRFRFPYTWSVLRSFTHPRIQAMFQKRPWHTDFYDPEHPSGGLDITVEIAKQFQHDVIVEERTPVIIIIPTHHDLITYQNEQFWVYQSLIDRLNQEGIEVLNVGSGIMTYIGQRDICEITPEGNCSGHYNEEGYEIIANLVHEHLKDRDLVP